MLVWRASNQTKMPPVRLHRFGWPETSREGQILADKSIQPDQGAQARFQDHHRPFLEPENRLSTYQPMPKPAGFLPGQAQQDNYAPALATIHLRSACQESAPVPHHVLAGLCRRAVFVLVDLRFARKSPPDDQRGSILPDSHQPNEPERRTLAHQAHLCCRVLLA